MDGDLKHAARRLLEALRDAHGEGEMLALGDDDLQVILIRRLNGTPGARQSGAQPEVRPRRDDEDDGLFDPPWKATFLEWLRRGVTVKRAAELSGVTRRHAYRCRAKDPKFRRAWGKK